MAQGDCERVCQGARTGAQWALGSSPAPSRGLGPSLLGHFPFSGNTQSLLSGFHLRSKPDGS